MNTRLFSLIAGVVLIGVVFIVGWSMRKEPTQGAEPAAVPRLLQLSAPGVDAAEPVTASAPDGMFYVAWVNHEAKKADVMLARLNSDGEMQGSPVRVNRNQGVATAWRGDQPSLSVAHDGSVYVVWTARVEAESKHGTDLFMSVSNDRGQSFASEVKINDDKVPGAHGMHSLAVAKDGRIYVGWLDERNVVTPKPSTKADGHHMESNRELYLAYSTDGGRSFSANRKVAVDACPCCKTSLAVGADGTVYAGWRQVLPGNFRHIAVASSTDGGQKFSRPVIVSDDRWMLQGCPVSGPSLSVDAGGSLKVVWYAAGEANAPGLYFAESKDKAQSFSARQLVAEEGVRGTPALAVGDSNSTIAVWQSSNAAETKMAELGKAGAAASVAVNAELPAGTVSNGKLFVAYIAKEKEKRSVWLVRAD
ncbi:MAG TPA: sialidase family protein [Pyrinomonadaceae bacterium]|nr:sialidase family protein [Pyrinomonadaceae bacterium]